MNKEALILKIEAQAAGERACGNHEAAEAFDRKANAMRKKYNLPRPEPVKEQPTDENRRRAVEKYWESLKPTTEVIVEVLEPGLMRPVQRVTTMAIALPLLKRESARLVRIVNGSNEFRFAKQEVGPPVSSSRPSWFYFWSD